MLKLTYLERGVSSALDPDEIGRLEAAFHARFLSYLDDEKISVECGFSPNQAQMRVTLRRRDGTLLYPVEAAVLAAEGVRFDSCPGKEVEALIGFHEAYWQSYFQEGRSVLLTLDWAQHQVNNQTIFARGFERNLALIEEADRILREGGPGQYQIETISSDT